MMADKKLIEELWRSDQASALTNRAAREIEKLEAELQKATNQLNSAWGQLDENNINIIEAPGLDIDIVSLLKRQGFEKKVYSEQCGSPVFYSKSFTADDVPVFSGKFSEDNPDESPENIVFEVSEDGSVLQFVAGIDYMESISPFNEPEKAKAMLADFGIELPN